MPKTPNVQQVSLRAPASIKDDGKTTEWNNKFSAYNPVTELYYTIANDDKRLYVVFMSGSQKIAGEAAIGGVKVITAIWWTIL